ncbi:phage minor tail protein G [Escherichia coli]
MFLKQGTFNYEKQSVVLSELSGLQRIEYLAFVQQRTAKFDAGEGELPEAERQIAFLRMGMDINAWLVSRSLWNADQSKDVETLCASVITTWSYDALGAGAEMVLSLSGFVMRLAREFRRADWRRMLSEMSATELGEWGDYFRMQSFSDVWMDAQFASLKALIVRMVSGSSDAAVADFSLLPEENEIPERTDEELMHLGEGISGGVRYGPDSQPGH